MRFIAIVAVALVCLATAPCHGFVLPRALALKCTGESKRTAATAVERAGRTKAYQRGIGKFGETREEKEARKKREDANAMKWAKIILAEEEETFENLQEPNQTDFAGFIGIGAVLAIVAAGQFFSSGG